MERKDKQLYSVFGKWWLPFRIWFYPLWLAYELSIRFYGYTISVNDYFIGKQVLYASYFGERGIQILAVFCRLSTFALCTAFLTVPACFVLYNFFKTQNLTSSSLEVNLKRFF